MKTVALALTWDGARWPVKKLTPKARAFLTGKAATAKSITKLFADDQIRELRVCWVPLLKGGADVLSAPFAAADGKRLSFRTVRTTRLGDMLGVIYQRT